MISASVSPPLQFHLEVMRFACRCYSVNAAERVHRKQIEGAQMEQEVEAFLESNTDAVVKNACELNVEI